jgi:dual specificity MAP kinase phosphatase
VHCGAGVSRSAALCLAYLMRRNRWTARKALEFARARRAVINPNEGFWRALCALELALGLAERSDPETQRGVQGVDSTVGGGADGNEDGDKVKVTFVPGGEEEKREGRRGGGEEHKRQRSRSRDRRQRRSGSRDRGGRPDPEPHPPISSPSSSSSSAVLEVLQAGRPVGRLLIALSRPSQACAFGRLPSCEVTLNHPTASRRHAQLATDGSGGLAVTDLGSGHGTNVDGAWIKPNAPKALSVGSVLRFGADPKEYTVVKMPGRKYVAAV